jgi:hypothetical protein
MEKTEKTDKTVLRNKSIGTKVSEDEYAQLEKLAEARGLTLSEWFRELVLAELIAHPAEQVVLAEVLALRMLYLNTVQILGRGRELTTEARTARAWISRKPSNRASLGATKPASGVLSWSATDTPERSTNNHRITPPDHLVVTPTAARGRDLSARTFPPISQNQSLCRRSPRVPSHDS